MNGWYGGGLSLGNPDAGKLALYRTGFLGIVAGSRLDRTTGGVSDKNQQRSMQMMHPVLDRILGSNQLVTNISHHEQVAIRRFVEGVGVPSSPSRSQLWRTASAQQRGA